MNTPNTEIDCSFRTALDDVVAAIIIPGYETGKENGAYVTYRLTLVLHFENQHLEYPDSEYFAAANKLADWRARIAAGEFKMPGKNEPG